MPLGLRIGVQEIYPGGGARPALTDESLALGVPHKRILKLSFVATRVAVLARVYHLTGKTFRVLEVVFALLYVRVRDHNESHSELLSTIVHQAVLLFRKLLLVEQKVLLLIGVVDVHPEHVNLILVLVEVLHSFDHLLS